MTTPEGFQLDLIALPGYVRALARELVFDAHSARDVEQETLLAALANGPPEKGALKGWLAVLARHVAYKAWRSSRRRMERERAAARPEGSVPSPSEILEREEQRKRLIELVLALEEPLRSVIVLRFLEELPPPEVARRLGLPLETVRTRLKRGLAHLRERLDRESGGDRTAWCLAFVRGLKLSAGGAQAATSLGWSLSGVVLMSLSKKAILSAVILLIVAGIAWLGQEIWSVERPVRAPGEAARLASAEAHVAVKPSEPARDEPGAESTRSSIEAEKPQVERAAPAEGSLLLRVSWQDGTPAAGIGATIQSSRSKNPFEGAREVRTESDGTCRIDDLPPGRALVWLDRGVQGAAEVRAGELTELPLTIPSGIDVQGIVVEADGSPVAGAEIFVDHGNGIGHVLGHSGADGRFRIRALSRRSFYVSARAPFHGPTPQDYVWALEHGAESRTHEVRLVFLERGGALEGLLLDGEANPVTDAQVLVGRDVSPGLEQVRLPDGEEASLPSAQRVPVDDEGRFHFAGVAPGTQPLWVRARGFGLWKGEVRILAGQVSRMEVVLLPGTTVEGVLRNATGEPIPGLPIVLVGSQSFHHKSAITGGDGAFAMHDLPAGEFELVVYQNASPTIVSTRLVGSPGALLRWDPVLGSHLSIRGRIVTEQAPTRFLVSCSNGSRTENTQPDPSGRFEFRDRDDVAHRIEVSSREMPSYPLLVLQEVRPSGDELVIEVDPGLWPCIRLKGRVLDAAGQPLESVHVMAEGEGTTARPSGILWEPDPSGAFDIGPLPAGRWRVEVWRSELWERLFASDAVEVHADETFDFGDLIVDG